jgi:hypothetical protein
MAVESQPSENNPSAGQTDRQGTVVFPERPAVGAAGIAVLAGQLLNSINPVAPAAPAKPLPAGTVGTPVSLQLQAVRQLFSAAASPNNQASVVWTQDGNELMVITGKVTVSLDEGLVTVSIPVECDQAQSATTVVTFAVGSSTQPAGLVAATEQKPQGPALIVDLWGDALTAFAWRLLLSVSTHVAAQSGIDEDGAGLVPIALTATEASLTVLPIARHTFDRVQL